MRPAFSSVAPAAVVIAAVIAVPQLAAAQAHACFRASARTCHSASVATRHRHVARAALRRQFARYGRPFHIPRFNQAEAEAEVHTVYPYRTGIYAPWPEFYGTPYYPPY